MYLNHLVIVFLFDGCDGIEDLGHGVQHPTLRQGLGLLCQGLVTDRANPEADKDVGETEEAENKDQGLQQVIRVKRVDNPAEKGVKKSVIFQYCMVPILSFILKFNFLKISKILWFYLY